MLNSKMLGLRNKLSPETEYELNLFYLFYYFFSFSSSGDFKNLERKIGSLMPTFKDKIYGRYIRFLICFFRVRKSVFYINVGGAFSALEKDKKENRVSRIVSAMLGVNVHERIALKGFFDEEDIFEYLERFRCDSILNIWEDFKGDQFLRAKVSNISNNIDELIRRLGVRAVVAVDVSDPIALFFLARAQKCGVKIVTVPHGYIQDYSQLYAYAHLSDFYFAWSNSEAERINNYGVNVEACYSGCPTYSQKYVEEFSASWKVHRNARVGRTVGFFANPLWASVDRNTVCAFLGNLSNHLESNGIEFFVKLHQRDEVQKMKSLLLGENVEVRFGKAEDMLLNLDLALGFQTTVLYQAKILGVRSCQICLESDPEKVFSFDGVEVVSGSVDELGRCFKEICFDAPAVPDFSNEGFDVEHLDRLLASILLRAETTADVGALH